MKNIYHTINIKFNNLLGIKSKIIILLMIHSKIKIY